MQADIAVVIPVPKDRRSLFIVPWGELAYVGTTDTDYDGPLDDPQCTPDDIAYVLRALNFSVTTGVTEHDVLGTWAGLRPLVKSAASGRTADLSRRHKVTRAPSNVVTVTGGKLTTYRRMAVDTVDEVMAVFERRAAQPHEPPPPVGADGFVEAEPGSPAAHLNGRYGSEAPEVEALLQDEPALAGPLVPGLPYLAAEAVFAARHEMAITLDDILSRRTRARLLARDDSAAAAPEVAAVVGPILGWDDAERARQVKAYVASVEHERTSAKLPETALDAALGA